MDFRQDNRNIICPRLRKTLRNGIGIIAADFDVTQDPFPPCAIVCFIIAFSGKYLNWDFSFPAGSSNSSDRTVTFGSQ